MSIFGDLIAGGLSGIIGSVGKVIDDNVTSDEERLAAKLALEKVIAEKEASIRADAASYEHELTERLKADMASDAWLAKNIRPLTLGFLTVMTVALAWASIFGSIEKEFQPVLDQWINLLTALDLTAFGFYFGGRGLEKIVSTIAKRAATK